MADIQALSHGLHPRGWSFSDWERGGGLLRRSYRTGTAFRSKSTSRTSPRAVSPELSLCLYRVLQEALQNVVKHSANGDARVSIAGRSMCSR
jgi:signal transduction histidine kinase